MLTNNHWIQVRGTYFKPLKVHRRVKFVKSQSFEIIGIIHRQEDRWQKIWELEELNFERFARGRAATILAIGVGKDTWQEINILLIYRSEKPEVRVVRTREA
jgi:hypothetical protein